MLDHEFDIRLAKKSNISIITNVLSIYSDIDIFGLPNGGSLLLSSNELILQFSFFLQFCKNDILLSLDFPTKQVYFK